MKSVCAVLAFIVCVGTGFILSAQQEPKVATTPADIETVAQGNNEFALDLFGRLREQKGNIVFSPYSISSAMAMVYAGTRGETAEKMAKVLHFTLPQERFHPAFGQLTTDVTKKKNEEDPTIFHIANALWGQKGVSFLPEFVEVAKKHYRAGLRTVDFVNNREL